MEVIVFESQAYYKFLDHTREMIKQAVAEVVKSTDEDVWLDDIEARKLLNIKSKTKLQSLRDNGEIIFSQHGRTILYSRSSILKFLAEHSVKK